MRFMPYLDASGEASIEEIVKICKQHHSFIIFAGMRKQPLEMLDKAGISKDSEAAFTTNFDEALKLASKLMADPEFVSKHQDTV